MCQKFMYVIYCVINQMGNTYKKKTHNEPVEHINSSHLATTSDKLTFSRYSFIQTKYHLRKYQKDSVGFSRNYQSAHTIIFLFHFIQWQCIVHVVASWSAVKLDGKKRSDLHLTPEKFAESHKYDNYGCLTLLPPLGFKLPTARSMHSLLLFVWKCALLAQFFFVVFLEAQSSNWKLLKASPQAGNNIQV